MGAEANCLSVGTLSSYRYHQTPLCSSAVNLILPSVTLNSYLQVLERNLFSYLENSSLNSHATEIRLLK